MIINYILSKLCIRMIFCLIPYSRLFSYSISNSRALLPTSLRRITSIYQHHVIDFFLFGPTLHFLYLSTALSYSLFISIIHNQGFV